jgi:hypothetical protein
MVALYFNTQYRKVRSYSANHYACGDKSANPGGSRKKQEYAGYQLNNAGTNPAVWLGANFRENVNGFRLRAEFKVKCLEENDGRNDLQTPEDVFLYVAHANFFLRLVK